MNNQSERDRKLQEYIIDGKQIPGWMDLGCHIERSHGVPNMKRKAWHQKVSEHG